MRGYFVMAVLGVVAGCRPATDVAVDSSGVPVVTAKPDAAFGDVRYTLSEVAAAHPQARLRLAATTDDERVELSADDNDDLEDLIVVRVTKRETVVGGRSTTTDDEIRSIAEGGSHGGASRFAVVRAEDDARVTDVMRATRAVKGSGVAHTILSRRAPSARAPSRPRAGSGMSITCDWPSRAPRTHVALAKAVVEVVRDAEGVGRVRVVSAPAGGFRQAAAFCASTAELPPGAPDSAVDLHVEFQLGDRFACDTPGDDQMPQGAYTPNEMNARYGTLPSAGCDRFPR